jgi:transposase-like protein
MEDFTKEFIASLIGKPLGEIVQLGAQKIVETAVMVEFEVFLQQYSQVMDERGRPGIVKNGNHRERTIMTSAGELKMKVPRVRDRREGVSDKAQFHSSVLPPYLRRAQELDEFIPYLYLKGISTGDFSGVLSQLLGKDVKLSANTVVRLKETWEKEYEEWSKRDLSDKRYLYWWVDGVYFNIRLEDERSCMLVIIGVTEDGRKELVAVSAGHRESELSWQSMFSDLKKRGLQMGPRMVTGDGALGSWKALGKEFPEAKHQRCWVHKTANVLDKLPKSVQFLAKSHIHKIYEADTKQEALKEFDRFVNLFEAKYPKAVACLVKDKAETLAFYDFPAEHWRHIRSTNVIESVFASVRLRTYKTKGMGSTITTLMMIFKLAEAAEKSWQRIHHFNLVPLVLAGVKFIDGVQHAA